MDHSTAPAPPTPPTPGRRRAATAESALIRRAVTKTIALAAAPPDRLRLVAQLVGMRKTEVSDLAVAVLVAEPAAFAPIAHLNEILAADEIEAGVVAASLTRDELKGVYGLLHAVGALNSATPAASDTKAALAAARAARAMTPDRIATVAAVGSLVQ